MDRENSPSLPSSLVGRVGAGAGRAAGAATPRRLPVRPGTLAAVAAGAAAPFPGALLTPAIHSADTKVIKINIFKM